MDSGISSNKIFLANFYGSHIFDIKRLKSCANQQKAGKSMDEQSVETVQPEVVNVIAQNSYQLRFDANAISSHGA